MQAIGAHSGAAVRPCIIPAAAQATHRACSWTERSSRASRQPTWQRRRRSTLSAAAAQEEQQYDAWGEPIGPGEIGMLSKDLYTTGMPDGIEGKAGYTPYEFIDFTDIQLKHELVARVERPISEVYALWENRLNWPEWFGMIEEVGFKEGDDDVCALNLWYRWAMTPWLELYVALRRTQAERDKYFVEEPEDGAPLVAAVLFQEEEGSAATLVTLRVSYLLPRVLFEFAGQLAVYGDVDRKLTRCMARMKEWVESVEDVQEELAAAAANMADIRAGLPEHRKLQQEADARFEEQKRREEEQEEKEQQQAEEAAAAQATADLEAMAAADLEAAAAAEAEAAALPPPPPKAKRGRKATGPTVTNPMAKRRSRKDADMEP